MANIIVVGVDGGEPSLRAAHRAGELAAHLGASLHVVTALDKGTVEEFAATYPERVRSLVLFGTAARFSRSASRIPVGLEPCPGGGTGGGNRQRLG